MPELMITLGVAAGWTAVIGWILTAVTTVSTGIRRRWMIHLLMTATILLVAAVIWGLPFLLICALPLLTAWVASCVTGPRSAHPSLICSATLALSDAALALRKAGADQAWIDEFVLLTPREPDDLVAQVASGRLQLTAEQRNVWQRAGEYRSLDLLAKLTEDS